MDAHEAKQYAMTTVLVKVIADNTVAIGASEMATTEAAALFDDADGHAKALAPYALTRSVLDQLRTRQAAFADTVRTTSTLIDQRSQSTSSLLRALMQQVYELDKPMAVFRVVSPALFSAYKRARRVGSAGGKGSAPSAAQVPTHK